ncbi:MAG TPA: hypothetical protein VK436_10655 [Methanocella sp.]|nr:hypothetical protein [Methanocella sp.]
MIAAPSNFKPQKTLSTLIVQVGGKDNNILISNKADYGQASST